MATAVCTPRWTIPFSGVAAVVAGRARLGYPGYLRAHATMTQLVSGLNSMGLQALDYGAIRNQVDHVEIMVPLALVVALGLVAWARPLEGCRLGFDNPKKRSRNEITNQS